MKSLFWRKNFFKYSLIVAFMLLAWQKALSQTPQFSLILKSETIVVGPRISLAEVSILKPASKQLRKRLRKLIIAKAAPPGESKDITLSIIKLTLRRAKLTNLIKQIKGPRIIRVKTAHKDITRMRLQEAVAAYVDSALHKFSGEWKLEFKNVPDSTAVPVLNFAIRAEAKAKFKRRGYQIFSINLYQNGIKVKQITVGVLIHTYEKVAIARERILPRSKLTGKNTIFSVRETTFLPFSPIKSLNLLSQAWTLVNISKGKIITKRMIEKIPEVMKGEIVELSIQAGNVAVQTQALAQQSGNLDDWIRLWNQDTRKILRGQIVGKGKVRIKL